MNNVEVLYWLVQLAVGAYMLGVGYKLIPDPGKKNSEKNKVYFNKYRGMLRIGGIVILAYVVLSILSIILE